MRTIDQPNLPWILLAAAVIYAGARVSPLSHDSDTALIIAWSMWDRILEQAHQRQEVTVKNGGDK